MFGDNPAHPRPSCLISLGFLLILVVVAMMSASPPEGRRFDPGQVLWCVCVWTTRTYFLADPFTDHLTQLHWAEKTHTYQWIAQKEQLLICLMVCVRKLMAGMGFESMTSRLLSGCSAN